MQWIELYGIWLVFNCSKWCRLNEMDYLAHSSFIALWMFFLSLVLFYWCGVLSWVCDHLKNWFWIDVVLLFGLVIGTVSNFAATCFSHHFLLYLYFTTVYYDHEKIWLVIWNGGSLLVLGLWWCNHL